MELSNIMAIQDKVITGSQDNGTFLKTNLNWDAVIGGDGMECIIDYTNSNTMYGALYYGDVRKSTNGGNSFYSIGPANNGAWETPYELDKNDPEYYVKQGNTTEQYIAENSIVKVYGSEAAEQLIDHCFQIFGGYGFIEEYPMAQAYRDNRINKIWEGTNEINRMLIVEMILKKAIFLGKKNYFSLYQININILLI